MMIKSYDRFSKKNMRMSRDLEGTKVSPVIWAELYDQVGQFSKSLMAPSDYRANNVSDFRTKNLWNSTHVWPALVLSYY
ncbi:unnamed protein product [Staurois parvus]|uniref:Uncharacterized protein n=1 Tax=Staurois parvus TaxID=386267 RepID=A0ABN9D316_9NEOB|nr:unnamed protein product [Staurois parvus]